jgi:hypothetical protein
MNNGILIEISRYGFIEQIGGCERDSGEDRIGIDPRCSVSCELAVGFEDPRVHLRIGDDLFKIVISSFLKLCYQSSTCLISLHN